MEKKTKGNVMDLVTIGITILAMTIVVMVYLECMEMMLKKLEVSQVSRKYILKMETEGYLSQENKTMLLTELKDLGLENVDVSGTTLYPVTYGDTITLKIRGGFKRKLLAREEELWNGGFSTSLVPLEEIRMSTAKN